MLYIVYASTLQYQISEGMNLNGFADDHSVNKSFNPNDRNDELRTIELLESSLQNINSLMSSNRLQMNTSKTEFMMIGSRKKLSKCVANHIKVCNDMVVKSEIIRLLGKWIDSNLNLKTNITKKCQTSVLNIFRIKHIRRYPTQDACEVLVLGLVMSHFDSLYYGLPDCDLNRLQRVQSITCKLELKRSKYDSCTECFTPLHWLPIRSQVQHKILTMVHNCLNRRAPEYLGNLLTYRSEIRPSRGLRSELNYNPLQVPKTKLKKLLWQDPLGWQDQHYGTIYLMNWDPLIIQMSLRSWLKYFSLDKLLMYKVTYCIVPVLQFFNKLPVCIIAVKHHQSSICEDSAIFS